MQTASRGPKYMQLARLPDSAYLVAEVQVRR
jgi:hypothetical protein